MIGNNSDSCIAAPSESVTPSSAPSVSLFDHLDELLLSTVVAYVGKYQYRFVAAINKRFRNGYLKVFPDNKCTIIGAFTLEQAKICFSELDQLPWRDRFCYSAARHGNLLALQAEYGHLDVVQWCRQNGCPWDERTCAESARNGHLDVLQWCRENGCPWDERTCAFAALNGHLYILQWCRQHGCPWDEWTCTNAAYSGYVDVLEWCQQNGCPCDDATCAIAA
jgi:hypothetical protein